MKKSQLLITFALLQLALSLSVHPHPKYVLEGEKTMKIASPCDLSVGFLNNEISDDVIAITEEYLHLTFKSANCKFQGSISSMKDPRNRVLQRAEFQIVVSLDSQIKEYALETQNERYTIDIEEDGLVGISAGTYVGYLRALETLSQMIQEDGNNGYKIEGVPLTIEDEPAFPYRSIMIDTSRHYLSVDTIKKTIDSMILNKLNVLHWHITDDESFPLLLKGYSQITKAAAYSDKHVFTYEQVKEVLDYAKTKGVQVYLLVPEIDTPGHVWSWGKAADLEGIIVKCGLQYGQFDPTLELTYTVVESVFREVAELFKDSPFIHFGGDEVVKSCWDKRPSIKEYMAKHNIKDYVELQTFYREKQKAIWKKIKGTGHQAVAYWANQEINLPVEGDDVVHWWGKTQELEAIKDKPNRIILSNYDLLYLDTGFNNAFGNPYSTFHTWKQIYQTFDLYPKDIKGKVIGGEVCLWGETNTEATHFLKLYVRTSAFAERVWNPTQLNKEKLSDFVKRLVSMENRMLSLGFPVLPVSSQYCTLHIDVCFP